MGVFEIKVEEHFVKIGEKQYKVQITEEAMLKTLEGEETVKDRAKSIPFLREMAKSFIPDLPDDLPIEVLLGVVQYLGQLIRQLTADVTGPFGQAPEQADATE